MNLLNETVINQRLALHNVHLYSKSALMKTMGEVFTWVIIVLIYFTVISGCRHEAVEVSPFFESTRSYRHNFYSSEEECRRVRPSNFVCGESMFFNTKGEVMGLLYGSDIYVHGTYEIVGDSVKAIVRDGPTMIRHMKFVIISPSELLLTDNNTVWTAY